MHELRKDLQKILEHFEALLHFPKVESREAPLDQPKNADAFWRSFGLMVCLIGVLAAGIYAVFPLEPPAPVPAAHAVHDAPAPQAAHNELAGWIEFFSITSVGLLLLAAGLFHFRGYRHAYEVHVATYESMIQVFGEARRRLHRQINQPTDLTPQPRPRNYRHKSEMQTILTELGADALAENSDWAATHHSRPLEPPLG
jgi:hypothetical protein